MTMLIRDVVRQKEDAAFRNDVQLSWYADGSEENLALAKTYIFARKSIGQQKSPIDVLYQLRQAFLTDTFENRFMVIATYGHGKSHLALALANYFGKPSDSLECNALLGSIEHAFNGEAEAQGYTDFKQSRKRMLVVCLDGTLPGDLTTQFMQALRKALHNEPETKIIEPPFWTREAVRLIDIIAESEGDSMKANEYLGDHNLDIAMLQARLLTPDAEVYEIVRELVYHVKKVYPDLGGPVNLALAVEWVADELCGIEEYKPFSGVLILFDEFSAFLRNYSLRRTEGTPLQKLLDGVSNRKGKVVFTAFGQLEPLSTIDSVFSQSGNSVAREALMVEISRLPTAYHYQLYTTMEDVLDTYLAQDVDALTSEFDSSKAWPVVLEANDDCLSVFHKHYEIELGWDSEQFQQRVTIGSYPLHPMTTALLCNVELRESANPRSVLGFVFDELDQIAELPVVSQQQPNWVNPIRLVDQFEMQLADEEWKQYQEAMRQRGGDLTTEESRILKAMLLHLVGRMPTNLVVYCKAISNLSGLTMERVEEVLVELARLGVIEHQAVQGKYSFWSLGGGARKLHEHISQAISGQNIKWNELDTVNRSARGFHRSALPVSIPWAHPDDWQAEQYYLTRLFVTKEKILDLAQRARGLILWLVALNDDDVLWFNQKAQAVLDIAAGNPSAPIVMMVPTAARAPLLHAFQKHCILKNLSPAEVNDYGGSVVQSVKTQISKTITDETQVLVRTKDRTLIPQPFVAAYNAGPKLESSSKIIKKAYELSFTSAPPAFFTQYKKNGAKLCKAVKRVSMLMLENKVAELIEEKDKTADLLLLKFLIRGESTSWGLLSREKLLQVPANRQARLGWDKLDSIVPADGEETPMKIVVDTLLTHPFGYDTNTLTLLFCGWFGYHRHRLKITVDGAVRPRSYLAEMIDGKSADLVNFLETANVRISRKEVTDPDWAQRKAARVQCMSEQPFSRSEANGLLGELQEYLEDETNEDQEQRNEVKGAYNSLNTALELANKYDEIVDDLIEDTVRISDIPGIVKMLGRVGDLPVPDGVVPKQPKPDIIRDNLKTLLASSVAKVCSDNSTLPDITHYQSKRKHLNTMKRALADYLDLKQQVTSALKQLEVEKDERQGEQSDQTTIAVLEVMHTSGSLSQLRNWQDCASNKVCHSEKANKLRAEKITKIRESITKMEEFISSVMILLDSVMSLDEAKSVSRTITRTGDLYAKTPESKTLEQAVNRCDKLEKVFGELSDIKTDIRQISNPNQVSDIASRIQNLVEKYDNVICPQQKEILKGAFNALDERQKILISKARDWLELCIKEALTVGSSACLQDKIVTPPVFLSVEDLDVLMNLRKEVGAKLNADYYEQVMHYFEKITDRLERKRLLSELQAMLIDD